MNQDKGKYIVLTAGESRVFFDMESIPESHSNIRKAMEKEFETIKSSGKVEIYRDDKAEGVRFVLEMGSDGEWYMKEAVW